MDGIKLLKHGGVGVAIACLSACSNSDSDTQTGSLTVALRDQPVQDVAEVWVEFDGLTLRRSDGAPIDLPFDGPISVDLLTLTGDNTEILLDDVSVPAGFYEQLALHVNAEHDGEFDSYVVTNVGGQEEIFVPSGDETGLKLVDGVSITADRETSFLIDWDVRMGLADPPGLSGQILRPAFRVIDMTAFGTLSGTVAMSLIMDGSCTNDLSLDTGNAVYIYEQFDFTADDPDDVGGAAGPTPVATATVGQEDDGTYTYETILSPGDYTVAFTCQADDDDPETDETIAFVQETDVTIVDEGAEEVNFVAEE